MLTTTGSAAGGAWLTIPEPRPRARVRLVCTPYAGGGAGAFRSWARHLPPEIELCLVNLPGRDARIREAPVTSVSALVQALARAALPYLDLPLALFGHSMGALLSFELARELRREYGIEPRHLFVSGCAAPKFASIERARALLEPELFEESRLGGTPVEFLAKPEMMSLVLPILGADFAMCEKHRYRSEPPLDCPIAAYGGLDDRVVSSEELEKWREETSSRFVLHMFTGGHFFLRTVERAFLEAMSGELLRVASLAA